jgi:hypothetical protein
MMRRFAFLFAALVLLSTVRVASAFQALTDPIPEPIPQGSITVTLKPVADGLVAPI